MISSFPRPFPGTREQAQKNLETHRFDWSDPDTRCWDCDCRPSHEAARYPCGEEPPRIIVSR